MNLHITLYFFHPRVTSCVLSPRILPSAVSRYFYLCQSFDVSIQFSYPSGKIIFFFEILQKEKKLQFVNINDMNHYILIIKANEMHYFSNLFDKVLYMLRTGPLSIIRSISTLYTQQ